MISPSVKLQVWASQLAADDFPQVCVYSGEPADSWWWFRPFTTYRWARPILLLLLLFVVGFVLTAPLGYVLATRAGGHLPMKAIYARRLWLVPRVSAAILGVGVLMLIVGLQAPIDNLLLGLAGVLLVFTSIFVILVGLIGVQIGLQVAWNPLAPRGRILKRKPGDPDALIEISNGHPVFVAAAQAMYAARIAHPTESK